MLVERDKAMVSALAAGTVHKPFDIDVLLGAVAAALAMERSRERDVGSGANPTAAADSHAYLAARDELST